MIAAAPYLSWLVATTPALAKEVLGEAVVARSVAEALESTVRERSDPAGAAALQAACPVSGVGPEAYAVREPCLSEVLLRGQKIAYRRSGRGRPVVLLHGGAEDGCAWRLQLGGLADGFEEIAWDAPGCGASDDVPETWRMPDYADALAGFLAALGVERPHLVGLSWGSTLALEFERRHPGVAASLVLAGAYAGWAGSLSPGEVEARLRDVLAAAGLPRDRALEGLPGVLEGPVPVELATELAEIWADNMGGRLPGGYRAMAHAMAETDLRPVLPLIAVPTLLLYGELDRRSPLAVSHELHARIPGSRLVVIAGIGHLISLEAPEEFNAEVRRFLRSVEGPAPSS